MKRFQVTLVFGFAGLIFLFPHSAKAQTNNTSQNRSEQVMSELLDEVRMLRQEVRRLSAGTIRAHALLERLKVQQDQVNRLTVDLTTVRGQLTSIRSQRAEIKVRLPNLQQKFDAGALQPSELEAVKAVLADIEMREPELASRELQLNNELNVERGVLEELNKKFEAIERELQVPSESPKRKP